MRWDRTNIGGFLAAGLGVWAISGTASAEPTRAASPVSAVAATDAYRQGFLDGYRARSLSNRRHVDRPYPPWRDRGSARPRDGYGPYWRNRPRHWLPPDVYAERRFRGDGPTGRRWIAPRDVIEATSNGAQQLRSAE